MPSESEPFRRFIEGEPALDEPNDAWEEWATLVRQATERGVAVGRVRVVTVPHTDYHRWLLTETIDNIEAGEDIRYLPRHSAGVVPADDFWLFDDVTVGFNLTDSHGRPAGAAVTTDPEIVHHCRSVKNRLWSLATPYAEYRQ